MDIAVAVGIESGLTWKRWEKVALRVEELGFAGLFRDDHFASHQPPDPDALELWVSLTWLASHTQRIQFGPLVSPMSFRHPALTARMAAAVDDLSNGRLILGLGAGWQQREHNMFGLELMELDARFERFEEGLWVIRQLLASDAPVSLRGKYYRLEQACLLPRPQRPGGPPVLVGGNSLSRTLPVAAKHAQEWNCYYLPADRVALLNRRLDVLLLAGGRKPSDVRRSLMVRCMMGGDSREVQKKVAAWNGGTRSLPDLRQRGWLVGTPNEIIDQVHELRQAGLDRLILHWLDLEDLQGLEDAATQLLPHFP